MADPENYCIDRRDASEDMGIEKLTYPMFNSQLNSRNNPLHPDASQDTGPLIMLMLISRGALTEARDSVLQAAQSPAPRYIAYAELAGLSGYRGRSGFCSLWPPLCVGRLR